jgi:hypothetical protein
MSPDPDHPVKDPEDIPYFFDNWCSLPWTPWVPFNADRHTFNAIPHAPGLYRIRPAGKDFLMYIGETKKPLHLRLSDLRQSLRRADLMPWSDPLAEAPALWAWWSDWSSGCRKSSDLRQEKNPKGFFDQEDEKNMKCSSSVEWASAVSPAVLPEHPPEDEDLPEGAGPVMLECSAAPLDASAAGRKGMESYLLYKYRQERGESPLCNFGRFHPRYRKSTSRREGLRGGRLAEDHKDNPAGFPSITPLEATGKPGDRDWMGLEWTDRKLLAVDTIRDVAAGAGLYLIAGAGSEQIIYIGQSADVATRLLDHSRKTWDERVLEFSYQIIGQSVLPHNLRELENDCIGNYFEQFRKAPELQYRNSKGSSEP